MIKQIKGDLFDTHCQVIIHGCNTEGVMGAGVAKGIASRYPRAFSQYKLACQNHTFLTGRIQPVACAGNRVIINCATQVDYARVRGQEMVALSDLSMCIYKVVGFIKKWGYSEFAMPKMGAGLGGLSWEIDVFPIIQRVAEKHKDVDIYVYSFD